ncbi:Nicotianamine synthase [Setomelanomma holmii]|uniref:Nicotianamine synthase n=1 Tax=Setomelanomma holmii TaxID=210430 RepID=A0A9P4LFJ0_9PLEO|nr:Nicotianamine synthase [Setomelanomma holmii]
MDKHILQESPSTNPVKTAFTPPRTPTAIATSAHTLLAEIQSIFTTISSLQSLGPGPQINALLTRLVNLCIAPYNSDFESYFLSIISIAGVCSNLRLLCAAAESELESHWASRIIASAQNQNFESDAHGGGGEARKSLLDAFPYHQNYIDLSLLECNIVNSFLLSSQAPRNITFIGSGPLPLSSLCMLDCFPDAVVWNIDRDAAALQKSGELSDALGYAGMRFVCADVADKVADVDDPNVAWMQSEVVFLAALVGSDTSSKITILSSLVGRLRPGTLVVARSARGLRSVLYPVLELGEEIERFGLEVLVEVHPWTKVVNSVVVMRVKER